MRRLYVLVRTDLERSSPALQAGHAVAEFMIEHPDCDWQNHYLIYLKVKSLEQLMNWKSKLCVSANSSKESALLKHTTFSEPDLNNEMTALAVYGVDANIFKRLRLL